MVPKEQPTSSDGEVYRQAWEGSYARISYGLPFSEACSKHVAATFKSSRAYIIASGSLSRDTDHVKQLQQALGEKVVGTRYGMKPHTLWSEILQVTEEATQAKSDLLITLGAGTLTDGAKIIATAIANNAKTFDDLDSLHVDTKSTKEIRSPTVPIISIPTSLSGGEYSHRGGGSNDHDHRKYSFSNPTKGPRLVILDPELTKTTPDRWWLSSGVRAVDHCTEAMCSLKSTPASNIDAGKGLSLLVPGLLRCKKGKDDLEARFSCQMGVIEAMKAANVHSVPMGASHGIGHQLGPLGVGHGETSCILLPAVCKYNESVNAEQQRRVCEIFWAESDVRGILQGAGLDEKASLGDMLDAVFKSLGMPRSLGDFGIGEDQWDALAENSMHDRWVATNPRPLTGQQQVKAILEMAR